jgi:hypothetical protein
MGRLVVVNIDEVAVCDSCRRIFEFDPNAFYKIKHLDLRVEPGCTVPAAECPRCGKLAYPILTMLRGGPS